jgi:hypothetical protein
MVPVNSLSPYAGALPVVVDRPPTVPVAQAVATDLAPAQSVTASETALATRNDETAASSSIYQRTVVLDQATQELIFKTVDVRSRQVVRQVPDEAMLRMRAYARALTAGKTTNEALSAANLEI